MERNKREATVIIAKCKQSKRPFGIRVEKMSDGVWHCNWTFKIDEKAASHEGYGDTLVSGRMTLDPEYPGCPYCGSMGWFSCGNCKKLTCQGEERFVTCAWCGNSGETEASDTFDLHGGNY